jgi:para-nitrobenzyl esterase
VPTFAYEFNDENAPELFLPNAGFPYGAAHASEIQYLFDVRPSVPPTPLNATQQQLAGNMVDYWTAFAANSNPNHLNTPAWHLFNAVTGEMQSLVPPTSVNELTFAIDHKCAFWDAASGRVLP